MANYATLKAAIDAVIKANGHREITGTVLNQTLNAMVNSLGANYQLAGVATPSTNPGTPDQNVFYLAFEAGTYTNFNATVLSAGISIFMWNGSWSSQTFYTIDATPTASSNNLVSSGAVFDAIKTDGSAYDVSAHFPTGGPNNDGKFTLEYILSNANTLIPTAWRKGGMSIRFVQSSDNKYVQYRLMSDTFNTTVTNWQGVDDEPITDSDNLVKSKGVYSINRLYNGKLCDSNTYRGETVLFTKKMVKEGDVVSFSISDVINRTGAIAFYSDTDERLYYIGWGTAIDSVQTIEQTYTIPSNFSYCKVIWHSLLVNYVNVTNSLISINENKLDINYKKHAGFLDYGGIIASSNSVYNKHIIIPVKNGDDISLTGGSNIGYYAILTSYSSSSCGYAEGYSGRGATLNANATVNIKVTDVNAKYLYLWTMNGYGVDQKPSGIYINGYDVNEYFRDTNISIFRKINEVDEEPTPNSKNFVESGGVANVNGHYITNPEFMDVITDGEGKIVKGLRKDGDEYWQAGVPKQIKREIRITAQEVSKENYTDADAKIVNDVKKYIPSDYNILHLSTVTQNQEVFNSSKISGGSRVYITFVCTGTRLFVTFLDSSNNEIYKIGAYEQYAGYHYEGYVNVPSNYSKAVVREGGCTDFNVYSISPTDGINNIVMSNILDNVPDILRLNKAWIPDYLKNEMTSTLDSISLNIADAGASLVLPILTDSHEGYEERSSERAYETLASLNCLVKNCFVDGIIHLGDIVDKTMYSSLISMGETSADANKYITRHMQSYLMHFFAIHKNALITNGNHDGIQANVFKSNLWHEIIGRALQSNENIHMYGNTPYFYIDYNKCNVRCVFMSQPDSVNNASPIYGWSVQQLDWLANVALDVDNGMKVILFSHIPPFQASYLANGEMENLASFYGIVTAFNTHTSYSDANVSCDFSSKENTKILIEICGHAHGEYVYEAGEEYQGTAYINGETVSWTYKNNNPFPVAILTNTFLTKGGDGTTRDEEMGLKHVPRADKTVTQESWNVLVYRPDWNKIFFLRYGSGIDCEVNV